MCSVYFIADYFNCTEVSTQRKHACAAFKFLNKKTKQTQKNPSNRVWRQHNMTKRYKSSLPKDSEVKGEQATELNMCLVYVLSMDDQFVSHML